MGTCKSAHGVIRAGSCIGNGACFKATRVSIRTGCCTAAGLCAELTVYLVGAGSCAKVDSCVGASGTIATGSDTSERLCQHFTVTIAAGMCTGPYDCSATSETGELLIITPTATPVVCFGEGITVGAGACLHESSCYLGLATIGAAAYLGVDTCYTAAGLIGAASCIGVGACETEAGASFGALSYIGQSNTNKHVCQNVSGLIGADPCLGLGACSDGTASIAARSCTNDKACEKARVGTTFQ